MNNRNNFRRQNENRPRQAQGLKPEEMERQEKLRRIPTEGSGFINPYNFVSFGSQNRQPIRFEPVSHENFNGLSGEIVCEIENLTPLCIPDPEATEEIDVRVGSRNGRDIIKKRKKKPFLLMDQRPALPASSIKGMLRSVIEALTDSCMSILTEDMSVFRDNRQWVPESRKVGWLRLSADRKMARMDPSDEYADVKDIRFPRSGLFNQQEEHAYHPRGTNEQAQKEVIPENIMETYRKMLESPNFTWMSRDGETHQPDHAQKEWLLDLEHKPASDRVKYWWFRSRGKRVVEFGRNFRYKWAYDPRQAVPERYHPCQDPSSLCPACALMGMAGDDNKSVQEGQVRAVAGRVQVSFADWLGQGKEKGEPRFEWITDLKILGAPHLSARSFYLKPSQPGRFNLGRTQNNVGDIDPAEEFLTQDPTTGRWVATPVRGRKFYWHHIKVWDGKDLGYFQRIPVNGKRPRTDQNSKVQVLMPGGRFQFRLRFENLCEWELGLLLWALALADVADGAHHLGLGKPLGLGTCKVILSELKIIDRKQRYEKLDVSGTTAYSTPSLEAEPLKGYLSAARQKLLEWFGGQSFQDIPHLRDLCTILSLQQPYAAGNDVPITYPPGIPGAPVYPDNGGDPIDREELHYTWFGGRDWDWSQALLSIEEIRKGGRQIKHRR